MKILMLSTDAKIFDAASPVRARILEYGKLFEELHIVVYTRPGFSKEQIGNITLEPTNTRFRLTYFFKAFQLGKAVLERGVNWVVTSQDPFETGWVAYRLKKSFGVPFQAQAHTDFLSPYFKKSSFKNRLRSLFGPWIVGKADRIRVVSDRIKKSLIALDANLEKKIVVLPIFVDKEVFSGARSEPGEVPGIDAEDFFILTVARSAPEKNLELANSIIAELKMRGHRIQWLLANDKSSSEVRAYYKRADLFLLTSIYEGYGMAAVEAAAAGIPVVMTDVGVALGSTFPVGNKEMAVALIEELINSPEKRKKLVEKQNEFFRNWPTKEQYLEQYKKDLTF